jgi:hypothetical protein
MATTSQIFSICKSRQEDILIQTCTSSHPHWITSFPGSRRSRHRYIVHKGSFITSPLEEEEDIENLEEATPKVYDEDELDEFILERKASRQENGPLNQQISLLSQELENLHNLVKESNAEFNAKLDKLTQ